MTLFTLKNAVLTAVTTVALATPALADDRYDWNRRDDHHDNRNWDRHDWDRHHDDNHVNLNFGGFFAPPPVDRIEQHTDRVWIEPVYRTTTDRVWVEPVYRNETVRVWVEPVYEIRNVERWEYGRRVIRQEQVQCAPGHFEDRTQQTLVSDGRWNNVDHVELVSPGHFEDRVTQVRVEEAPQPAWNFMFGFHGR